MNIAISYINVFKILTNQNKKTWLLRSQLQYVHSTIPHNIGTFYKILLGIPQGF